jgi:DNA-directed RNA polymerase sigma subunit (sigma70/sigma32)
MITLFSSKKAKWQKDKVDREREERDEEIRRICDELRAMGEVPNYAAIGRTYGLTRERIRQIDEYRPDEDE